MPEFDWSVHRTKKQHGGSVMHVVPYIMLTSPVGSILIRDGKFWDQAGVEVPYDMVPEWAKYEASQLSPRARAEVGLAPAEVKPDAPAVQNLDNSDAEEKALEDEEDEEKELESKEAEAPSGPLSRLGSVRAKGPHPSVVTKEK